MAKYLLSHDIGTSSPAYIFPDTISFDICININIPE